MILSPLLYCATCYTITEQHLVVKVYRIRQPRELCWSDITLPADIKMDRSNVTLSICFKLFQAFVFSSLSFPWRGDRLLLQSLMVTRKHLRQNESVSGSSSIFFSSCLVHFHLFRLAHLSATEHLQINNKSDLAFQSCAYTGIYILVSTFLAAFELAKRCVWHKDVSNTQRSFRLFKLTCCKR